MTLQTHQELKLLERVERIELVVDALFFLCEEIKRDLDKMKPKFPPTHRIHVTPHTHHGGHS